MNNRLRILALATAIAFPAHATKPSPPTTAEVLGTGASATTYKAQWKGKNVAYKKLKENDKRLAPALKRERKILKKLNKKGGHPQIVHMLGYVKGPEQGLVLELMQGDLLQFIDTGLVGPRDWHNLLTQMFLGLSHMHSNKIVHCDLKPENILCSNKNGLFRFKLSDFGLSGPPRSKRAQGRAKNRPGTLIYMAPEIFYLQGYDSKADMWSAGILIATILTGLDCEEVLAPIDSVSTSLTTWEDTFNYIDTFFREAWERGHIARDLFDGPYKLLVKKLCELEPSKRWSAQRAIKRLRQMNPEDFVTYYYPGPEPVAKGSIGVGATAAVFLADWQGQEVAYKVMRGEASQQIFERELAILQRLQRDDEHPNIVALIDYIDHAPRFGLVLELMHGDLYQAMSQNAVNAGDWQDILVQVFLGLSHIHGCGLVYGDLKPENILCKLYRDHIDIKLSDFGHTLPPQDPGSPMVGSLEFIAPEVLFSKGFDEKADMWSAGILLSELFGLNPQIPVGYQGWLKAGRDQRIEYLKHFFRTAKESGIEGSALLRGRYLVLFFQLCSFDPSKRPTARDAAKRVSSF